MVKHKDIKLTSNEARRNFLPNQTMKQQNLLATEMKKAQIFMNKTVHQYQN